MGGVTYLLVAQCPSIVPIVVIYAKTVNVVVWAPGVIYVTPGKHRLLQHFRVSPVSIAWHDPVLEMITGNFTVVPSSTQRTP
jgi:hypothetical protein